MALTAAQIVARACTIAKAPGYTVQAGQYLNMVLDTLSQTYDFDYAALTTTINYVSGTSSYALPDDHLRTREVFYSVNGVIFYLNQVDIRKYNSLYQAPGVDNYPYEYATDVSTDPNTHKPYPPPAINQAVSVVYFPRHTDIVSPETSATVPWFINQEYLIKKVAAAVMLETDDPRGMLFDQQAKDLLSDILTMTDDKEGYAQTIKLDKQTFRNSSASKPNKAFPLA